MTLRLSEAIVQKERGFTLIETIIVVAIIGILFAIAMGQYQNYQVRTKVAEVLVLSNTFKRALETYYVEHNKWPEVASQAGLSDRGRHHKSTYIKAVNVAAGECGIFSMRFKNNAELGLGKMANAYLWFKPTVSTDGGTISWYCGVTSLSTRKPFMPNECKNARDHECG